MTPASGSRSILVRLTLAAFLADMALYLTMTGAPYKALALGAGPLVLGFLPVARALPYSLTTVWAGHRSEGRERLRHAKLSLLVAGLAVGLMVLVSQVSWIHALLAVVGLSLAFFWPAVQATLADVARTGNMTGNLGWFNIGWSTGKAVGFILGGFLLARVGFGAVFVSAAVAMVIVAGVIATLPSKRASVSANPSSSPESEEHGHPPESGARFRLAAWIGNSVAFGIGAVLNTHYPEWLEAHGRGEELFGTYLGFIFGAQTLTFAVLARVTRWHYRALPLLGCQVPLIGVLIFLPRMHHPGLILATAPLVGFGLGVIYFSSLYYSVHAPASRGRNAGVHEALLGLGAMVLPVLGGWVASRWGRLEAPYLVSAGIGFVALMVQAGILARNRTNGEKTAI